MSKITFNLIVSVLDENQSKIDSGGLKAGDLREKLSSLAQGSTSLSSSPGVQQTLAVEGAPSQIQPGEPIRNTGTEGKEAKKEYSRYAAGLLLLPYLEDYGLFSTLQELELNSTGLTLALMPLLEIDRLYHLNQVDRRHLGMIVGRDKSPLQPQAHRELSRAARKCSSTAFTEENASRTVEKNHLSPLGFLDMDGHHIPYYGSGETSKGFNSVLGRAMKGAQLFLASYRGSGRPVYFRLGQANRSLKDSLPGMVKRLQRVLRYQRIFTVFDGGGFKGTTLRSIDDSGAVFITPAKKTEIIKKELAAISGDEFIEIDGVRMTETRLTLKTYGEEKLRAVALEEDGRRWAILTNALRGELAMWEVYRAYSGRWDVENILKELGNHLGLDSSPGWDLVEVKKESEVKGYKRGKIKSRIERLISAYLDGALSLQEFKKLKKGLESRLRSIRRGVVLEDVEELVLEKLALTTCFKMTAINVHRDVMADLGGGFERLTVGTARRLFYLVGGWIGVEGDRLVVELESKGDGRVDEGLRRWAEKVSARGFRLPWNGLVLEARVV